MSFGGFLGIGDSYHPLPWQSLTYDEVLRRRVYDVMVELFTCPIVDGCSINLTGRN